VLHVVCLFTPQLCRVPVLTAPTHEGMAQAVLTWVLGSVPRWFTHPKTVTHPGTNWARCRVTTVIETNALSLFQTIFSCSIQAGHSFSKQPNNNMHNIVCTRQITLCNIHHKQFQVVEIVLMTVPHWMQTLGLKFVTVPR